MNFEYDNTLQVKQFAQTKEAKALLNIPTGVEKQLFKLGDKVTSTETSCIDLEGLKVDPIISDVWEQNGHWYYKVQWKSTPRSRKVNNSTFRQKDLKLI